jgi:hypothetical protein
VLKPGGRLAVAFRSPESLRLVTLAWDNFRGEGVNGEPGVQWVIRKRQFCYAYVHA